jgi:hypothetical protein
MMQRIDFCLAWNWEYDRDFISLLEKSCTAQGLSSLLISNENLGTSLASLQAGELSVSIFLDRASDTDPAFIPLADQMKYSAKFRINPRERTLWAIDKATMHLEFISRGLDTPYTILLSPCGQQPDLPILDLALLGKSFAIKPASLGGGDGVVLEATSREQVVAARRQFPQEKYLLQAHLTPKMLAQRPAWFRMLVCDGAVYPCWWDPHSHVYTPVLADERFHFKLGGLFEVTRRVAQICQLDLFSTEVCLTEDGRFLLVDYVNDPVDLRLKSRAADGVPDWIVENIASRLARLVARHAC